MRTFAAISIAILFAAAGLWIYERYTGGDLTALTHGPLFTISSHSANGKFLCGGGVLLYVLKPDGTFFVSLGPSPTGFTTAGTYKRDGDRIILAVEGRPPQVLFYRDGMLSIAGTMRDCQKATPHADIASGSGRYSCGDGAVAFEFEPSDVVHATVKGQTATGTYEIYGTNVIVSTSNRPVVLSFSNGVLGQPGLKDCVKT